MLASFSSVGTNGKASFTVPGSRAGGAALPTSGETEDAERGATTTALALGGAPTPGGVPSEHAPATRVVATSARVLPLATRMVG